MTIMDEMARSSESEPKPDAESSPESGMPVQPAGGEESAAPSEPDGIDADEEFLSALDLDGGSLASGAETHPESISTPVWLAPMLPGLETLGVQTGLVLSDKQREHVSLLSRMLETEDVSKRRSRPRRDHTARFWQHLMRFGTAVLLLSVVILNVTRTAPRLPKPQRLDETGQALAWIERLEKDDRILVAFDYQPGFAAEVERAALPILERAVARGARIQTISTLPLGPLLAERFWSSQSKRIFTTNTAPPQNLGFLPGGSLGLANLGAAFIGEPDNISSSTARMPAMGERSPFVDPVKLAGVRLVVVLTEDAQKGRDWIEQVQTDRRDIPLVIVTSAQAAPILRPYLGTSTAKGGVKQIAGLVSGLAGGLSLEDDRQPDSIMSQRWNAYEMAGFIAGVTILAALVAGQLNQRRQNRLHPNPERSTLL